MKLLYLLLVVSVSALVCYAQKTCIPDIAHVQYTKPSQGVIKLYVEPGYTVTFALDSVTGSSSGTATLAGDAAMNISQVNREIIVGDPNKQPASTTSPGIQQAPMWILSLAGVLLGLRFPRSAIVVALVALIGFSQVRKAEAECYTKLFTLSMSYDYFQSVRLMTNNTLKCPAEFPLQVDGQCLNWSSTYTLLYSNKNNPTECQNVLPSTATILANDEAIKTNSGAWYSYTYSTLSPLAAGAQLMTSLITLANGQPANLIVYGGGFRGFNNFPVSITSGSSVCNATYSCTGGACLSYVTNTTSNFWCNSWNYRDSVATDCSAQSGTGPFNPSCSNSTAQTCPPTQGCFEVCEQAGSSVTCGACDARVYDCGQYKCPCCNSISPAANILPSFLMTILSFAAVYLMHNI